MLLNPSVSYATPAFCGTGVTLASSVSCEAVRAYQKWDVVVVFWVLNRE